MTATFRIAPRELVSAGGRLYEITSVLDMTTVLARDQETGQAKRLLIADLQAPEILIETDATTDLASVSDDDWQIAKDRFEIIKPLLDTRATVEMVKRQAKVADVHIATVYRWRDAYERSGLLSSLLPTDRSAPRKGRLQTELQALVDNLIETFYIDQAKSITTTHREIEKRCRNGQLPIPHYNTVRNRILKLPAIKLAKRQGKKALERHQPIRGHNPDARWPLALYQIDHTPLDRGVVDEDTRQPIGKPWLTLAIDVNTRMVPGFYLSLDAPCANSVGMCLIHSMLPKEHWLAIRNIDASWPIWGKPDAVHADNAQEFRGRMLTRACDEYSIDIHWRPVARPNYGGHIERLLGTFAKRIKELPDEVMTLSEMERWIANYVTKIYHQEKHDGIHMPPIKKYEEGIFGNDKTPGRGLPERVVDEERLKIDFLPYWERTVQNYGIVLDDIYYYSDVLNRWINARDPKHPKQKRLFIVKRNPLAISPIYFHDPELNEYFAVPYRDNSLPVISIWELRAAKQRLMEQGREVHEQSIFDAYDELRAIEDKAVSDTRRARRAAQSRRYNSQAPRPNAKTTTNEALTAIGPLPKRVVPFDELEDLEDRT